MTREQLLDQLARRRARKVALTWAQFATAVQGADVTTKGRLLDAANSMNGSAVALLVLGITGAKKYELALEQVELLTADDSLTVDELTGLLD